MDFVEKPFFSSAGEVRWLKFSLQNSEMLSAETKRRTPKGQSLLPWQHGISEGRGKFQASQANVDIFLASTTNYGIVNTWGVPCHESFHSHFTSWAEGELEVGAGARVIGWDEQGFISLQHPTWIIGSDTSLSSWLCWDLRILKVFISDQLSAPGSLLQNLVSTANSWFSRAGSLWKTKERTCSTSAQNVGTLTSVSHLTFPSYIPFPGHPPTWLSAQLPPGREDVPVTRPLMTFGDALGKLWKMWFSRPGPCASSPWGPQKGLGCHPLDTESPFRGGTHSCLFPSCLFCIQLAVDTLC